MNNKNNPKAEEVINSDEILVETNNSTSQNLLSVSSDAEQNQDEQEIADIREGLADLNSESLVDIPTPITEFVASDSDQELDKFIFNDLPKKYQKIKAISLLFKKTMILKIDQSEYCLSFDQDQLNVSKDKVTNPNVSITLDQDTLAKICNYQLNPQIALLSKKIKISGDFQLGLYFFNLLN